MAAMLPMRHLTWVHVSDLHFGQGPEATTRVEQEVVTEAILQDLELMAEVLGSPDYVFLTGDIAHSADPIVQYVAASNWISRAQSALDIPKSRVFMVPGNHDVDRIAASCGAAILANTGLRAKPKLVDALFEDPSSLEQIWPKLKAYQAFAKAYGSPEINCTQPFWNLDAKALLGEVKIVGLNSVLLSFDNQDSPTNLALGIGQLHKAIDLNSEDKLLIVLQHHPPDWLRDGAIERNYLERIPHMLFCGHIHEGGGTVRSPVTNSGTLEFVAGAGHDCTGKEGHHSYSWGQLSPEGLDYYQRDWQERERRFLHRPLADTENRRHNARVGEYAHLPCDRLPEKTRDWLRSNVAAPQLHGNPSPNLAPSYPPSSTRVPVVYDHRLPYFFVPYRPKREGVIGRNEVLRKVRKQLLKGRRTAIGQTASFVGIGGLGKTQIAVEYCYEFRDEYPRGVFWFTVDEDLDAQLARLAREAKWISPDSALSVQLDIAVHQIRTRSDCLIVFDNVEDLGRLDFLLPEVDAAPHLLLTSRCPQSGFDPVPLDRFDESQSLEMLTLESRRELACEEDIQAAKQIAEQLDGLPLALELVGAYLRRFSTALLTEYALQLESQGIDIAALCSNPKMDSFTRHEAGLRATLHLGERVFDQTRFLRSAVDLLAWSGPASMGRGLIACAISASGASDVMGALEVAESLRILVRENVQSDGGQPRFLMHRLVRDVRRLDVPLEAEIPRWTSIVNQLGDWFQSRRSDVAELSQFESESAHLEAWVKNAMRIGLVREAVRLDWLRAYPVYHRGRFRESYQIILEALQRYENDGMNDPELEAHLRHDIGITLDELGEFSQARGYLERALQIRKEVLGDSAPDTAMALSSLGATLAELEENAQALQCQEQAVSVRTMAHGRSHVETAHALVLLGVTLAKLDRNDEALSCQEEALEIRRKRLGEAHPDTATSLANVGNALRRLGRHREALEFHRKALRIWEDSYGPRHPKLAYFLSCIGVTLGEMRQDNEALKYKQEALAIRLESLGEWHPDTAKSVSSVGAALARVGEHREAFNHQKKALKILDKTLGGAHPQSLEQRILIAKDLINRKCPAVALEVVQEGLKHCPRNIRFVRLRNELVGRKSGRGGRRK